ncbi:MAG: amidohydrolase family protein [Alphaproteobacteria bacterium]|nr:amidohydrolase family protein [Alphaproteobacteria bacterium]MEC8005625.1 amidohydrolase family protein [Pseudomonadota bacterium]MEC8027485.1 amidohydrolase family protein [Pseudomonadota bacterium]MEC8084684.1 amidohydrolase family protein [Pseudomonadota bacterium]MEC8564228.1 amidohydrolase family protein [Pseudomonadota bacterium]
MSKSHDLVVRNGTLVDGTGSAPIDGDIAIDNGKISAIGQVHGSGTEEIDAGGCIVTPGFVDIHTHYDGQAIWDKHLAPSAWHGVTSVVMGNCGVGFAPCRAEDRIKLVELMEGVEDIPGAVMHEGLDWRWESFAEYLDALESGPRDVDVCALLPHAAVRVFVMGDRAIRHEAATAEDIAQMRAITRQAIDAGAFGFSTSRTVSHKTLKGDYTPTLRAHEDELTGIAMGMADAGAGFLEIVSDWNAPDPETEFAMLRRVIEQSGRTAVFSLTQRHDRTTFWRDLLRLAGEAIDDGLSIRPVVAPRPIGILLGLQGSQNPFSGTPTYKKLAALPVAERAAAMSDPEVRRQILSEDPVAGSTFPLINRISYDQMYRFGNPPCYEPAADQSISAMAAREGRSAPEVAYDIVVEDGGRNFIYAPLVNYANRDMTTPEAMLSDRNAIMGLGDGGAHVGFIIDAGFPTWLMSYWGRERGRFEMPEIIRRLTSDTAAAAGLGDRGRLAVGLKGDLNVIDWDKVDFGRPYVAKDLPAGGRRLLQNAEGYRATVVSGQATYRDGAATGALPGQLVRGQRAA